MGQTLTNGIYLPDEGEVRCYDGLASNWTTLDVVVGGYRAHIANENIHITSAERSKWDTGVTQAYVLRYANTSLTALGTVAFSALDNTDNIKIGDKVLDSEGKLFALTAVDTANGTATLSALLIDLSKDSDLSNYYTKAEVDALDSNAMHKTGNETVTGNKLFEGEINSASSIIVSQDSSYVTGIKDTKLIDKNLFEILNKRVTYNNSRNVRYTWTISNKDSNGNTISSGVQLALSPAGQAYFYPIYDNDVFLGASTAYMKGLYTKLINSLTPSSLSLPSYTASRIDISGYITDLTGVGNDYIVPANGFIFVRSSDCTYINLIEYPSGVCSSVCSPSADDIGTFIPVNKDRKCIIQIKCTSINRAFFIPCAGNI